MKPSSRSQIFWISPKLCAVIMYYQISCSTSSCLLHPKGSFTWGKHHEKSGFLDRIQIPVLSVREHHKTLKHSKNNFCWRISSARKIYHHRCLHSTLLSSHSFLLADYFFCFYGGFSQDSHRHRVSCRKEKSLSFMHCQHHP